MNHGYEYNVTIPAPDVVARELICEGPNGVRTLILRDVINTKEELTRNAFVKLGWTPPDAPPPPLRKCIVKGCDNHNVQGRFIGDLCAPCHSMLTTGAVSTNGSTFVHSLRDRLLEIANIAASPTKE
jgi:hypothetical protein